MNTYNRDNLTGKNHEGTFPNTPLKYLTASTLIGEKVINSRGERLGDVKDIMLDVTEGRVQYIVIEYGGFLGIGEKFFAVPFDVLGIDTNEHALVLDYDKEVLKNAPGFDKDHWPETNSHSYEKYGAYWGDFMGSNTGSVPY
jgi:sporulation protein YlmC with PRC-barrel domain